MERLTMIDEGQAIPILELYYAFKTQKQEKYFLRMIDRLAAYENTNLEPSEIEELKGRAQLLPLAEEHYTKLCDKQLKHIAELGNGLAKEKANAEKYKSFYEEYKEDHEKCYDIQEEQITLLNKALDRAAMLLDGKVTREGLLGVAEQELKAEGENEKNHM